MSSSEIYRIVVEALELNNRDGLSFLNVGSGSGYLSCIVGYLIGKKGLCHGVEIKPVVVEHSRKCTNDWIRFRGHQSNICKNFEYIVGNCFSLDTKPVMKYDRIYVGAGCPDARWKFFLNFLKPNGVLIVSLNGANEMIHVKLKPSIPSTVTGDAMDSRHFDKETAAHVSVASLIISDDTINCKLSFSQDNE